MLRIMNSLKTMSLEISANTPASTNINSIRWRRNPRKPIWKGTAKSKIFRVPPRTVIPQEEADEIKRLYNKYKTEMKTITRFFTSKYNIENQQKDDQDLNKKEFESDLEACMKLNDEWNAKQKVEREASAAVELEKSIQLAKERRKITEERRQQRLNEAEEIVRREKVFAKDFISPEMLDAAIEKALANPVDHNFALDLEGNKIVGYETPPLPKETASLKQ
ncbi:hypothetical protein HHI36_004031 [Cryptolaemus montrouzieri]|uniref:Small ribosomal subunit protein mS26 n=1 Tax=Cryptolaemus montrouzieri TaxID=559131 RepID=A0ABD2NQA1_9CUCU